MTETARGLILFAHGARDARWAQPFEQTAERIRALRPGWQVALAYLEFMPPDLAACGRALVEAGCRQVAVLPMFLGTGGHVRKDLPAQLDALRLAHRDVDWQLFPAIGESPLLIDAMAQIGVSLTFDTSGTSEAPAPDEAHPATR